MRKTKFMGKGLEGLGKLPTQHQAILTQQQGVHEFNLPGDSIRFHKLRNPSCKTAPLPTYFRCQSQAQVVNYATDHRIQTGGSKDPLQLRIQWLVQVVTHTSD